MKKLSLLVALMLLVTIGGVYATWSYAGTNDIADAFAEATITITDAELTGANGTYSITSNLVLSVDQASVAHDAKLVFASTNGDPIYLKVTFTPSPNAPDDIKEHAVPTELYFGTTTPMQYKIDAQGNYDAVNGTPTDILKFNNVANTTFEENVVWNEEADGTFTYTMDQTALEQEIQLSRTFVLDIKAEHDAFRDALNGNVIARVTDGIVS